MLPPDSLSFSAIIRLLLPCLRAPTIVIESVHPQSYQSQRCFSRSFSVSMVTGVEFAGHSLANVEGHASWAATALRRKESWKVAAHCKLRGDDVGVSLWQRVVAEVVVHLDSRPH